MNQIDHLVTKGYENMGFKSYKDGFQDVPNGYWFDELPEKDIRGVLKANYYENGRLRQIYSANDNHVAVVAGTGLGKTTQFVLPTVKSIARRKQKNSLVISDPKGEVYRICANELRDNGYRVLCLNFRDSQHSEFWNPLTAIYRKYQDAYNVESLVELVDTPDGPRNRFRGRIYTDQKKLDRDLAITRQRLLDDVGKEIESFALCLAPETVGTHDRTWEDGGRDIIKAFLWAMLEDSRPETKNVRNLITEKTYSFNTILRIFAEFDNSDSGGVYCDNGYFSNRNTLSKGRMFANNTVLVNARATRAGYMSVFNTQITLFRDPAVSQITSCNSFDFSELVKTPVAIFVDYKDESTVSYKLISLFVQQLYIYLIGYANSMPNGKLERPFYFLLDEFGNFPRINDFETVISACRGRNIYFALIIQSYAQLTGVYGRDTAEVIKDNLNIHIFIGSNNIDTLEAFSRECGKITRLSPLSALNGNGEQISEYKVETIPLMPISALSRFEEGECVVTEANTGYVMYSRLERYYKCPEFQYALADINDYVCSVDPYDEDYNYVYKRR